MGRQILRSHAFIFFFYASVSVALGQLTTQASRTTTTMPVGTTTGTGGMQSSTTTQPSTTTRPTSLSNASTQTSTTTRPTSSSNASTQASTTTRPDSPSNTSTQASAITNSTRPSNASTQASGITNSTQSSNASTQASGTTRPTPPSNASTQASAITNSTSLSNASTQASASTRPTPTMDTRNATTNAATGTLGMANNSTTKQYVSETTVSTTQVTTANLMSAGNAPETVVPSNAPAEAPAVTEVTVNVETINTTPETTPNAETQNTTPQTTIDAGPLATTNPTTNADLPEISEIPVKASTQAASTAESESIPTATESTTNAETKIVTTETTAANADQVSEEEVLTNLAINRVKKRLVAVEEQIAKMVSKLNGEQGRGSKTLANVAFFAQRNSSCDQQNTIQPYLINRLNDGKAFDQASGIFTVPMNGNYHFYFTALKSSAQISGTSMITIRLWANKNHKEKSPQMLAEGHINSNDMYGWFPVMVQATVNLQEKDTVEVELFIGSIHESGDLEHLVTSFGGFLVNPEVM